MLWGFKQGKLPFKCMSSAENHRKQEKDDMQAAVEKAAKIRRPGGTQILKKQRAELVKTRVFSLKQRHSSGTSCMPRRLKMSVDLVLKFQAQGMWTTVCNMS